MNLESAKRAVPRAFDRVAPTYDLLTGLNPGYHRHLRMSASRLALGRSPRVLDLCCGTGSSTEALLAIYPDADVVALDASKGMLARAAEKPVLRGVELVHGDAADPVAAGVEGPFDGLFMAYGLRNLPDLDAALPHLIALLAPGGRAVFHEYSVKGSRRSRLIWSAVAKAVIVPGGWVTAPGSDIYRYLHRSVLEFDSVTQLEARLRGVGFVDVATAPVDGWQRGIVHSFVARRPVGDGSAAS